MKLILIIDKEKNNAKHRKRVQMPYIDEEGPSAYFTESLDIAEFTVEQARP